ncbi:MAG: hypothetical protein AB1414_19285, partial [bacterium]
GTIVSLRGNGFGANKIIKIAFGTTPTIQTTSTYAEGSFTTTFTVDTQAYGQTTIKAYGSEEAFGLFSILPNIIEVTPRAGTVGAVITISGNGFGATSSIRIAFGKTSSIVFVTTMAEGSWTTTFTVDTQAYGTTTVTAFEDDINIFAGASIFILPKLIFISPSEGTVGSMVTVAGNGFGGNKVIAIDFGTTSSIQTGWSCEAGSFSTTWTVDTQAYGQTTIKAHGSEEAKGLFKILPHIILVSPAEGTVGTIIRICGNGYGANSLIRVEFGITPTIQITSSYAGGSFSTTWTVDTQPYGTTTVVGYDDVLGIQSGNKIKILPNIIVITPGQGTVGSVVTVLGNGFGANKVIRLDFGTTAMIQTTSSYSEGSWSTTFTVDTQVYGQTTIKASGSEQASGIFTILPNIVELTPIFGSVGTIITIAGNGFGKESEVQIEFNNIYRGTTAVTIYGSFSTTFTTPVQPYGTYTVMGTDTHFSNVYATSRFKIISNLCLITPTKGTIGTTISIKGNGFEAGNKIISIEIGTTLYSTVVLTNGLGEFDPIWNGEIKTQPYGTVTILATQLTGNFSGIYATGNFFITSNLSLITPTSGTVGTIITLKGDGFGASKTITIAFGRTPTIQFSSTGADGSWTTTFTVNTQPYGETTITASGSEKATGIFTILPKIILITPQQGIVGSIVSISGNGFGSLESITIGFGINPAITVVSTNNYGTFSTIFTVDEQAGCGTVTVSAKGSHCSASSLFVIFPKITLITPGAGTVGSMVSICGNGFGSLESITIGFGINPAITVVSTNDYGTFSTIFTVDEQAG